jgi:hypothetical protein
LYRAFALLLILCTGPCGAQPEPPPRHPDWQPITTGDNPLVVDAHRDSGPPDRHGFAYQAITYGRDTPAPLPNLASAWSLADWDGNGLTDILANLRRGGGLVLYRNVGTADRPRFRSLHQNRVLMREPRLRRYFQAADLLGDARLELVGFMRNAPGADGPDRLHVVINGGDAESPDWDLVEVRDPAGEPIVPPADDWHGVRVAAGDWDGDDRPDLVLAWDRAQDIVPGEQRHSGERAGRWLPPERVNTQVGRVLVSLNRTEAGGMPVFTQPARVIGPAGPLVVHHQPRVGLHDVTGDGRDDLIVGVDPPTVWVYPRLDAADPTDVGERRPLPTPTGQPIATTLALQLGLADMTGDGVADLITSSYHGNANRFMLWRRLASGFADGEPLQVQATPDTPVYGMGNSTVDVVDLDGDGDHDLLLGAERGLPTMVINVGSDGQPAYEPPQRLRHPDGSPWETYAIDTGEGSHWGLSEWYSDRVSPRAVDWDGDGTLDIISGSMGRRLYFARGQRVQGHLRFERPVNLQRDGVDLAVPDRVMPAVLDFTGDGTPDILTPFDPGDPRRPNADWGHIRVYPGVPGAPLQLGSPTVLRHADGSPIRLHDYWDRQKGNRCSIALSDWTGDGVGDLLVTMFHRGAYLAPGSEDGSFGRWRPLIEPLYSHNPGLSVFDYDRDGIPDLVMGGDERRMIEPARPAHLIWVRGQDTLTPPGHHGSPPREP